MPSLDGGALATKLHRAEHKKEKEILVPSAIGTAYAGTTSDALVTKLHRAERGTLKMTHGVKKQR